MKSRPLSLPRAVDGGVLVRTAKVGSADRVRVPDVTGGSWMLTQGSR